MGSTGSSLLMVFQVRVAAMQDRDVVMNYFFLLSFFPSILLNSCIGAGEYPDGRLDHQLYNDP